MDLKLITGRVIAPALGMLPAGMTNSRALVMMLAVGLQESGFTARVQFGNGPAHGLWQFEQGGGVKGVLNHPATQHHALYACQSRGVTPTPSAVWAALATDDVLAAAFARLLLYADAKALPELGDGHAAWECYLRSWRPGKPRPADWAAHYALALAEVA